MCVAPGEEDDDRHHDRYREHERSLISSPLLLHFPKMGSNSYFRSLPSLSLFPLFVLLCPPCVSCPFIVEKDSVLCVWDVKFDRVLNRPLSLSRSLRQRASLYPSNCFGFSSNIMPALQSFDFTSVSPCYAFCCKCFFSDDAPAAGK